MGHELAVERFFEILINGDRPSARAFVDDWTRRGNTPQSIITDVFWPTYELIDRLFRQDQLSRLSYHMSTRLLRQLADVVGQRLQRQPVNGKRVFACCGPEEAEELGAQMAVDMLEAAGYSVNFCGGGVPGDEILAQVQENQPDVLLMFASAARDLPAIREIIDQLRTIGACRKTQVVVGAGVFNRAEGLAEEIGADLWAADPLDLVEMITQAPERRMVEEQRTVGKKRVAPPANNRRIRPSDDQQRAAA
jgi:methanogenic corrinoid protein MtbC1